MPADYQKYPFPKGRHPSGWVETTVGEVMLEIRSGYSSGTHNQTGQGIPHLRPMNVSPVGEILMEDVRYVSPSAGSLRLAKDDVLFTNTSSTVWVGKTAVVEKPGDWGFSNHMTRLRVADGMSPEFVARQLHYLCLNGYFAFHCKKHINQSSVAGKQLAEDVPFRLPPANEQKRITANLRRLLERERKLRHQLDELPALIQQYRAAVLEAACTGHLVTIESELARKEHRDFEPATVLLDRILAERRAKWEADQLAKMRAANKESKDDRWKAHYNEPNTPIVDDSKLLPKGWVTASLGQVCFIDSGEAFKKSSYSQSGIRLLQIANVAFGHTDWQQKNFLPEHFDKTHPGLMLNPGDLVMALNRPILGNQLKVAHIITSDLPAILYQRVGRLRPVAANLSKYLFCFLRTDFFRNQVASRLKGSDQPFINTSQVPDIPIALPPDDEQKRIVAEVEHRLSALSLIENQVTLALEEVARFQGLLLKTALSGKLAHQNRSDEPASRLLLRIRKLKEQLAMQPKIRAFTPSRLKPEKLPMLTLEDIKSTHLADILHKHRGPLDSKTLWKESRLTIDDFYAQLKKELGKTLKETGKARLLEVKS